MTETLKTALFQLLTQSLNYVVVDHPYDENDEITYPFIRLSLQNITRDVYKNCFQYRYTFTIDIFSNYSGEQELMNIEEIIFQALNSLYNIEGVTYIRESGFKIIDDRSTGTMKKHGIMTLTILSSGAYSVDSEE